MPGSREVFRLTAPVVLWWTWVVFALANVADLLVQRSAARSALKIDAIVLVITGVVYALALRPRVIADQSGITIVNPFRDHHVPWAAIKLVDATDWVRVHYRRDAPASAAGPPPAGSPGATVECWALYVSARAKRRDARAAPPPAGLRRFTHAPIDEMPRMSAEAKYLASLPPAKAIAARLDVRAETERARAAGEPGSAAVTARWAWLPAAAVIVPVLALLAVTLT